jgi:phosphatidylinositol alpha-1,6-mannosyltransferase
MRVLLVTNDFPPKPGGIQQYLGNIVERYTGEVRVLGPAHAGAPVEAGVVRSESAFMWPTRAVRAWVRSHIEEFEPQVVVFGAPHPLAQMGPRLRAETGVPYVVMTHGAEVTVPAVVPGLRRLLARTFRGADHLFAVSRFTAAAVGRLAGAPVTVLGAGVDLDRFHPRRERAGGPVVVGCVSRFVPRKGHARVIAAAERLAAEGRDVAVLLVGRGRLEKQLRRRAATATIPVRIEANVEWSALPDLYRQMDVFAMPARSRWFGLEAEGLGIVYLEAAATGLPVLAGSSGGSPETVVPASTGFVATSVSELVEGICLALDDRESLGAAGRARAESEYSWSAVLERFDEGLAMAVQGSSHA